MMNSFSHGGNLATGHVLPRGTVIFVQRNPPVNWRATLSCPSGTKPLRTVSHTRSRPEPLLAAVRHRPRALSRDERPLTLLGPGGTDGNSPEFQRRVRSTN